MTTKLQRQLETLYGLERRNDKLGIGGTLELLRALGSPHQKFRSVHVAGTNGKGSTCALVERVLREAGYRTGLFTSPHLVDFRERIRVSGRWADQAWLARRLEHIASLPEGKQRTFFEVCTALAFGYFAHRRVEIAVVEVGLGGRLDCTNVLSPEVAVITSIGLDHTELLGDTVGRVAAEKAGIVKAGVPLVVGRVCGGAMRVIETIAREHGAPLVGATPLWPSGIGDERATPRWRPDDGPGGEESRLPLPRNPIARQNLGTAVRALLALDAKGIAVPWVAIARGVGLARWPGRLEPCPALPRLWWDGAHNVEATATLCSAWNQVHGQRPPGAIVLALSRDKDVTGILSALHGCFPDSRLLATRSRSERALDPAELAAAARRAGFDRPLVAPDVVTAAPEALQRARDGLVLLTGSLFAVGEAMEAFGGAPGEML